MFVLSGQMAWVHYNARGSASNSGERGSASTTSPGTCAISTGLYAKAKAVAYGCIALAWWNPSAQRVEMRCREIGIGDGSDGKLKVHTWYSLDEETSEFLETPDA